MSTTDKPTTADQGPEAKSAKDTPNRTDAADRDTLPGADDPNTTGYQSADPVEQATGDPDSIAASKRREAEKQAQAETDDDA